MNSRASEIILLCEDQAQERLTRSYLKRCNVGDLEHVLSRRVGGGYTRVLDLFPIELRACRQRHKTKAKTLLIVLVDADNEAVENRRCQLLERAKSAGLEQFGDNEPAVLLIPKRHIETWICALLGKTVTEQQDCKSSKKPDKEEFRQAAQTLFDWSRPNATPGPTLQSVPSLQTSLPDWRRIGSG